MRSPCSRRESRRLCSRESRSVPKWHKSTPSTRTGPFRTIRWAYIVIISPFISIFPKKMELFSSPCRTKCRRNGFAVLSLHPLLSQMAKRHISKNTLSTTLSCQINHILLLIFIIFGANDPLEIPRISLLRRKIILANVSFRGGRRFPRKMVF